MDIRALISNMSACGSVAARLHGFLLSSPELADANVEIQPSEQKINLSFWTNMPSTSTLYKVLVSVPPHAMGNRGPSFNDGDIPCMYETALIGHDGSLSCVPEAGYGDTIRRFWSMQDVVNELLRLATYTGIATEAPNADDE